MCKSVLLPTPDSPTIATRSATSSSRSNSRKTTISRPPSLYALSMLRADSSLFIADDFHRIPSCRLASRINACEHADDKRCDGDNQEIAQVDSDRNRGNEEHILGQFELILGN